MKRLDLSLLVVRGADETTCCATLQGLAQDADKYKATAAHVELSKKMHKRDPATAPVVGDRVPYVIIKVRLCSSLILYFITWQQTDWSC